MAGPRRHIPFITAAVAYVAVAAAIAALMYLVGSGAWGGIDADRFHRMAGIIINGFAPYIDFVDPKPPLLYIAVAGMDLAAPAGSIDIAVMAGINVLSALAIWTIGREDYGQVTGFSAGLLFLVAAVFVQGYFLFSEQFTVFFLLCAFLLMRRKHGAAAGVMAGLATGFKQYAILGFIPLLYLVRETGDRRYCRFLAPAIITALLPFGILYLVYGEAATLSALSWTIGIAPAYIGSGTIAEVPNYHAETMISYAVDLIASISMVLPTLVFAAAGVAGRGLKTPDERAIGLFVLVFAGTLLIRQYLHYWIVLLPFLALLACRAFADKPPAEGEISGGAEP